MPQKHQNMVLYGMFSQPYSWYPVRARAQTRSRLLSLEIHFFTRISQIKHCPYKTIQPTYRPQGSNQTNHDKEKSQKPSLPAPGLMCTVHCQYITCPSKRSETDILHLLCQPWQSMLYTSPHLIVGFNKVCMDVIHCLD